MASAPFAVALNRPYRLRLESIGTRHRVYMNGVPVLDADDTALASGRAALLTHRASAEFDNVVASPTPATILYADDFTTSGGPTDLWSFTGIGLWHTASSGSNFVFAQSSVAGTARAVIGVPTDDQSVDVRARPTTFAGTGAGDRWFGVMARYVDDSNYYYLTLRNTNTGVAAQAHQRRHHRARNLFAAHHARYLVPAAHRGRGRADPRLRQRSAGGRSHRYARIARGAAGPITNRAAVDFDDYRAIQP